MSRSGGPAKGGERRELGRAAGDFPQNFFQIRTRERLDGISELFQSFGGIIARAGQVANAFAACREIETDQPRLGLWLQQVYAVLNAARHEAKWSE